MKGRKARAQSKAWRLLDELELTVGAPEVEHARALVEPEAGELVGIHAALGGLLRLHKGHAHPAGVRLGAARRLAKRALERVALPLHLEDALPHGLDLARRSGALRPAALAHVLHPHLLGRHVIHHRAHRQVDHRLIDVLAQVDLLVHELDSKLAVRRVHAPFAVGGHRGTGGHAIRRGGNVQARNHAAKVRHGKLVPPVVGPARVAHPDNDFLRIQHRVAHKERVGAVREHGVERVARDRESGAWREIHPVHRDLQFLRRGAELLGRVEVECGHQPLVGLASQRGVDRGDREPARAGNRNILLEHADEHGISLRVVRVDRRAGQHRVRERTVGEAQRDGLGRSFGRPVVPIVPVVIEVAALVVQHETHWEACGVKAEIRAILEGHRIDVELLKVVGRTPAFDRQGAALVHRCRRRHIWHVRRDVVPLHRRKLIARELKHDHVVPIFRQRDVVHQHNPRRSVLVDVAGRPRRAAVIALGPHADPENAVRLERSCGGRGRHKDALRQVDQRGRPERATPAHPVWSENLGNRKEDPALLASLVGPALLLRCGRARPRERLLPSARLCRLALRVVLLRSLPLLCHLLCRRLHLVGGPLRDHVAAWSGQLLAAVLRGLGILGGCSLERLSHLACARLRHLPAPRRLRHHPVAFSGVDVARHDHPRAVRGAHRGSDKARRTDEHVAAVVREEAVHPGRPDDGVHDLPVAHAVQRTAVRPRVHERLDEHGEAPRRGSVPDVGGEPAKELPAWRWGDRIHFAANQVESLVQGCADVE
mmetsp:Transcript_38798/g.91636  ORF Transcript_38798/g.91636 Transcript_38798/m.91636 type:complete len:770 (-) Transcript_38798:1134-3443(-)